MSVTDFLFNYCLGRQSNYKKKNNRLAKFSQCGMPMTRNFVKIYGNKIEQMENWVHAFLMSASVT